MYQTTLDCPRCGRELISTGLPACPTVCPHCQPRSTRVALEVRARADRREQDPEPALGILRGAGCRTPGCGRLAVPGNDRLCDRCQEAANVQAMRSWEKRAARDLRQARLLAGVAALTAIGLLALVVMWMR